MSCGPRGGSNAHAGITDARAAPDGGRLLQPVLFVNGDFDQICTITGNRQGDPIGAASPTPAVGTGKCIATFPKTWRAGGCE
ncbi:hypothetical protein Bpla01_03840 [Burkholderia plantarii]|nr:hypothetical protein Bpla01_03840 [Burkholderia plantarii]